MISRLLLSCIVFALPLLSGCLFSKNRKPKESRAIAGEVEETFKRRWIDQRVTELAAQGLAAEAARTQATQEFETKFEFNRPAKK